MKKNQKFNEEGETLSEKVLRKLEALEAKFEKLFERKDDGLPRFVDQKTVARKIGKTVRTVYNYRDKYKIPSKTVNGTVYILAEPVEKLFDISFEEE